MSPQPQIAAVGEVLWDVFPDGPRFGGAPANFACHVAALGAKSAIISCVGKDELGRTAEQFLRRQGVDTTQLQISADAPTGTVQVQLDDQGRPKFEIARNVAWDFVEWTPTLATVASQLQAICFGSLGQRSPQSRETIQRCVAATGPECLRVLDINLRPPFVEESVLRQSLALANVLKLNEDELETVAQLSGAEGSDQQRLSAVREAWNLRVIALTKGGQGSVLVTEDATSELGLQEEINVVDTVGAGDSFTAALIVGLLRGLSLDAVHMRAARIAAYVCTQAGAVPALPADLRQD